MKKITTVILFSFVVANLFAQTDKSLQEYTISVNRMMSNNKFMINKYGFGISYRNPIRLNNSWELIDGIDFNEITFFSKNSVAVNHFTTYSDITYHLLSFKFPLLIRIHTNGKVKYFASTGFYVALNPGCISTGTKWVNTPTTHSEDKITISNEVTLFDYGICANIGCMIPIDKNNLLLKIGYNNGFRLLDVDYDFDFYKRFIYFGVGLNM